MPTSVLPTSGLAPLKLLAEQGSIDEILLSKIVDLWKTCEVYRGLSEDSQNYTYHDSMKLLMEHWALISCYIAKHLQPGSCLDQLSLTEFAEYHDANSSSVTSSSPCRRYYLDVWEESAYLNKLGKQTKLQPLSDWNDLFHQYDDSVDGNYREWLITRLDSKKEQLLKCPKKKRKIDPIFVPYDLTLSAENKEDLMKVVPPPVPVSMIHPAAWSVR